MLRIITGTIALLYALVVFGQTQADTIKVYFEVNRVDYNPSIFDNASVMDRFIEKVDSANAAGAIERIDVFGYSSPEGSHQRNQRLSDRRCRNIADYIVARTGVDPNLVIARGMGEAWDELRAMIEANPDVPYRARLLDIIDNTPEWIFDKQGHIIDGRKKQLMDLAGGRPYRWLLANIFPKLRYALTVSVHYVAIEETFPDEEIELVDTGIIYAPVIIDEPITADTAVLVEIEPVVEVNVQKADLNIPIALKTNLLDYGILMPNLEIEWMINNNWSVALEGQIAWYAKEDPHKVYRIGTVMPEVRYWPSAHSRWRGMYVGAFIGAGEYDIYIGKKGHEGEGALAGLSAGYMWTIGKCLSLEAGIGVGYLRLRDKVYVPEDGHFLYQMTKNINYVGPLRLKLSLVWRFQVAQ